MKITLVGAGQLPLLYSLCVFNLKALLGNITCLHCPQQRAGYTCAAGEGVFCYQHNHTCNVSRYSLHSIPVVVTHFG